VFETTTVYIIPAINMRLNMTLLSLLAGSLAACAAAEAVTAEASTASPYQSIVDRNVFGLKPPPPPPDPEASKPPPPKLILTGITTIFGNKRALMKTTLPAKAPEPAKEQSYMLAEGQRDGDIEVLQIDDKENTVKVRNFGVEQTLNFNENGVKLTSTLPGGPAPGVLPSAPGGIPAPAATPANPFAPAGGFNKAIPTRTLRLPTPGTTATPGAAATGADAGGTVVPGFGSGSSQPQSAAGPTTIGGFPTSTGLTPEQNVLLYEANRLKNADAVAAGRLPRMPAHPMAGGLFTPAPQPQAPQ
jgi:hypothetical protein